MKSETQAGLTGTATPIEGDQSQPGQGAFAYDWQLISSPGHTIIARLKTIGKLGFIPAAALLYYGVTAAPQVYSGGAATPPDFVRAALTTDHSTFFDVGGYRVGPELAFLQDYRPRGGGLTGDQWTGLVSAVRQDLGKAGHDVAKWTAVAAITPAPKVTRPEKALAEHSERLTDGGLVLLQPGSQWSMGNAYALAHVGGEWAAVEIRAIGGRLSCSHLVGPVVPDCPGRGGEIRHQSFWGLLKPVAASNGGQ